MKIDCLKFIEKVRQETDLTERKKLTVIQVGNEPASTLYVNSKKKEAFKWNIECDVINMPEDSTTEDVIIQINDSKYDTNGIIVQLPLPKHIDEQKVIDAIPTGLNVDGFKQTGKEQIFEPCTPKGIIMLLESLTDLDGKMVTLIGRGKTVGAPLKDMLLDKNCTVTVAHSHTNKKDLKFLLGFSDIIVSAVGKPDLFSAYDLGMSSIVIDAGISRVDGKQVGDFSHVEELAPTYVRYTPWTNGVGKLTVMALMLNVRNSVSF